MEYLTLGERMISAALFTLTISLLNHMIHLITSHLKAYHDVFAIFIILSQIWLVCDHVRELWTKSKKLVLTDQDVSKAIELYVQCLWYFTEVLEKFAKKGKRENNPR